VTWIPMRVKKIPQNKKLGRPTRFCQNGIGF